MRSAVLPIILTLLFILRPAPELPAQFGEASPRPSGGETAQSVLDGEIIDAQPLWKAALGGVITGPPTVEAGTVVVTLDGGNVRAFSLEGSKFWDYYAGGKIVSRVTRSREGTSYFCRADGVLIALNRAGRELWRLRPPAAGTASGETEGFSGPVISGWDGRIFVAAGAGIFCYTAAGYRLWKTELEHRPVTEPKASASGGLVMALENGELAEVNHLGAVRKRRLGDTPAVVIPAESGTLVLFRNGWPRFFPSAFRDGGANTTAASLPNLGGIPVSGALRGNQAAVLLTSGKLVCFSLREGKMLWTADSHLKNGEAAPGAGESGALEIFYDGAGVHVLSSSGASSFTVSGQRRWMILIRGGTSAPGYGGDGELYSGGKDWILYAYRLGAGTGTARPSFYGPAPAGSYRLGDPRPSPWAGSPLFYQEKEARERLAFIAEKIRKGTIGEDEAAITAYLMELAVARLGPRSSSGYRPQIQARERAEAARLLGFIGSRETAPFLADLFLKEKETTVRAAAAEAAGRIGADSDGRVFAAFGAAASETVKNDQVLQAAARATGSICRFSGPPLSDSGAKFLTILAGDAMPPGTRALARQELAALR